MKTFTIGLVVGCLGGFTLGFWSGGSSEQEPVDRAVAVTHGPTSGESAHSSEGASGDDSRALQDQRRQLISMQARLAGLEADDSDAEAEEVLQEVTGVDSEALVDVKNEAFEYPADLPEMFKEPALTQAITDALDELDIAHSNTKTDCDEYPCLMCTEVEIGANGDQSDAATFQFITDTMESLGKSRALEPYRKDESNTFSSSVMPIARTDAAGEEKPHALMCQTYYPKSDDEDHAAFLGGRVSQRFGELRAQFK